MLKSTLDEIKLHKSKIEIFGLGYVGFPLAIRLASNGFSVNGIDVSQERIKRLENNILQESEKSLHDNFLECRKSNKLSLSESSEPSNTSKIGIICVPTPIPTSDKKSDFFVNSAVNSFLNTSKKGDVIFIESSIEVGTTENIQKIIESKAFKTGEDFGLVFCPERIDPQNKKWHLENIPRVIYASDDITFNIAQNIYHYVNNSNLIRVNSPKVAEVVKSFENTFRLVNISLVNELAILCDHLQINVHDVIKAASTKPFGFMPFYSGAGAGGHCIPKDPLFLLESSRKFGFEFKTISNALKINNFLPQYISQSINELFNEHKLEKKIIVCGMSYKSDIEDMRDSPGFKILDELLKLTFSVSVFDPYFKKELLGKYLQENHQKNSNFEILDNLDNSTIQPFYGICIVQHHSKTKMRLEQIYKNSAIKIIYDCQNKLLVNHNSKSILKSLGR